MNGWMELQTSACTLGPKQVAHTHTIVYASTIATKLTRYTHSHRQRPGRQPLPIPCALANSKQTVQTNERTHKSGKLLNETIRGWALLNEMQANW